MKKAFIYYHDTSSSPYRVDFFKCSFDTYIVTERSIPFENYLKCNKYLTFNIFHNDIEYCCVVVKKHIGEADAFLCNIIQELFKCNIGFVYRRFSAHFLLLNKVIKRFQLIKQLIPYKEIY